VREQTWPPCRFRDETFDAALVMTVLEFVDDPAAALAEIVRVTRTGGQIVVGALNPHSPWGLANRARLHTGAWCTAHFLSRGDLWTLGSRHGRIRLHAALYAPDAIPGLSALGPILETIGHAVPSWGAFQVLTISKEHRPSKAPCPRHPPCSSYAPIPTTNRSASAPSSPTSPPTTPS
jgi:SAM-dependent methyltransferase